MIHEPETVKQVFAGVWGLKHIDPRKRELPHPFARFMAMTVMYREYGLTLQETGKLFDRREHTTVMHAIERHDDMYRLEKSYRLKYDEGLKILSSPIVITHEYVMRARQCEELPKMRQANDEYMDKKWAQQDRLKLIERIQKAATFAHRRSLTLEYFLDHPRPDDYEYHVQHFWEQEKRDAEMWIQEYHNKMMAVQSAMNHILGHA